MTDEHLIERSQKLEEQLLQSRIQAIRNEAKGALLAPRGSCYDCGEEFAANKISQLEKKFCDSHCEAAWNIWFQAQKRRFGPDFRPRASYTNA